MRLLALGFCLIYFNITTLLAQEEKKLTKKERKELKKQQQREQAKAILDLLYSKQWVIEAHTVFDRYNQSYQLNPTINFVGVKEDEGALQLGFDGLIGWNGVGGITVDGKITKYELKEGKEKTGPSLTMHFSGRGMASAIISVSVTTSGQATARVNGAFGDRITFAGQLRSLDESVVYKGQSIF